jgi:carbon-monoxide dehydrogenase medium subunit
MTRYLYPGSVDEALTLLEENQGKARVIAGGTDLMPEIRSGSINPETILDITCIAELQQIDVSASGVKIGAAVSFAEIKNHPFLSANVPVLTQAAASVGAGGIQQAATWAGNIVQAMPAADGIIAALALDAQAHVCSTQEESWLDVRDLFQGPKKSTVDPSRELITAIRFPLPPAGQLWGTAWKRLGRRSALILPILNCAVNLHLEDDQGSLAITKALVAIGPANKVPFLAIASAEYLIGNSPNQETFARAGKIASEEAHPRTSPLRASKEYRQKLIPVLVQDALTQSLAWAKNSPENRKS